MIGRVAGTLIERNPPHLLADCHGADYKIDVPMNMFHNLPATGEKVVLLAQQIMYESAHLLHGFGTATGRGTFRQLIKISGIDARIALAVLSGILVAELTYAVVLQEAGRLTHIPDIGKRTTERPLLELESELGADLGTVPGGPAISNDAIDVLNTLLTLGYSDKKAAPAIKQVPAGTGASERIKLALKVLSRGWHPSVARR